MKPQQMTIPGVAPSTTPPPVKRKNKVDTTETVASARARIANALDEGVRCPCCDQLAKRYKRTLNASMVRALFALWHAESDRDGWVDVSKVPLATYRALRQGDYPKLAYFGLAEPKSDDEVAAAKGARTSGLWRVTDPGALFIKSIVTVNAYVHVYDGKVVSRSSKFVNVQQALGEKFDYSKLMGGKL
jgi:hypothetical protein